DRLAGGASANAPPPGAARRPAPPASFTRGRPPGRTRQPDDDVAVGTAPPRRRGAFLPPFPPLSRGGRALTRPPPPLPGTRAHVVLFEPGPLVARLAAAGATSEVLAMGAAAQGLPRDRVRAGMRSLRAAWAAAVQTVRLARRLRRLRPDVVHANS